MALTPEIRMFQARTFVVTRTAAQFENVFQARPLAVYNVPAEEMHVSAAYENIVYRRIAQGIEASQSGAMVVYRGRIERPELRAWTFTLDNHDFYVLRLGSEATLVYDVYSEQWVEWGDGTGPLWWLNVGMSWLGGQRLAHEFGSSIVVGDDTFGRLWLLDPDQPFDDATNENDPRQERAFRRIVMGQVAVRGREVVPCYVIFLTGDNYGIGTKEIAASVTLETSDDAGKTFDDHGFITVNAQTIGQSYEWFSLGQIEAPGRLFRITDNGVFARIDSMDMNDGE